MNLHRITLTAVALLALSACQQQAATAPAAPVAATPTMPAPTPVADARAVIADYMAAWNAHDGDKAGSYFAEDGVYLDASVGTPQTGRQAATDNVIKVFLTAVPDCLWTMRGDPIATADGVAFEWTFTGTNTGDWSAETKASGKTMSFNGVSFVRVADGKITYQGDYYDAATLNKQMGW